MTALTTISSASEALDEQTIIIYLEVPASNVVLLQAYFETYEGIGIVRTLDMKKSLVSVLTTTSFLQECVKALESMQEQIKWRPAAIPSGPERDFYLGYKRIGSHA